MEGWITQNLIFCKMPCISSLLSFAQPLLADRLFCLLFLNLCVAFFTYNGIEKSRHIKREGWQLKLAYPKVFSKDVSFLNVFFWTLYTRVAHFHQMRIPIMFTFHIYFYLDIFLFFIILFFFFILAHKQRRPCFPFGFVPEQKNFV